MSDLITCTLEDICLKEKGSIISGPFGSNISSKYFVSSGIPVIRGNNLTTDHIKFIDDGFVYVTEEKAVGQVGIIPKNTKYNRYVISNKQIRVRLDTELVDLDYAYCWFVSPWIQTALKNNNKGSTVPLLTLAEVRSLPITYPKDKGEQKAIAKVFNDLDAKIDNNVAICSDLEAIAKLLYDYWFVQFDFPDENGKPYKSSGGKMVWNEELKREIPDGWEVKALAEIIASSKNGDWGKELPKSKDDIKLSCFRGADFPSITSDYQVTAPVRYISAKNADRLLSDGDLVTEISGGSPTQATGRIGYITQKFLDRNGGKMDCSNFCKAFTPIEKHYQFWMYQTWKALYNAGIMFYYEGKTTGIKNLMFDEFVKQIKVPVPTKELLTEYQKHCSMYYDKIQEGFIESAHLASLRDFLLPMLMNGQVKVKKEDTNE